MPLSFADTASSFDAANCVASMRLPDSTGLVGEYIFGTDEATSVVNLANASLPLRAAGAVVSADVLTTVSGGIVTAITDTTPGLITTTIGLQPAAFANCPGLINATGRLNKAALTYDASSVTVDSRVASASGFDTQIKFSADFTALVVAQRLDTLNVNLVGNGGNFAGIVDAGRSISGVPSVTAFNSQVGATQAAIAAPTNGQPFFAAFSGPGGAPGTLYLYQGGVAATANPPVNGLSRSNTNVRIGTFVLNGQTTGKVIFAAIFARALSASEIAAAYASIKAYFAGLGVAVS